MVQLTRIYTRGGDKGKTSLGDGKRVGKDDLRVEAYGTVDEANGHLGVVRVHLAGPRGQHADGLLSLVQNDLFDLGADLCTPESPEPPPYPPLRIIAAQVARLEGEIDAMNAELQPLKSFVLPAGCAAAAHLHVARTVVRRAERLVTALSRRDAINAEALKYLNRLSDHIFVMARWLNAAADGDVLWVPGGNR